MLSAISQPGYLARGPGRFKALGLTLGTLVWQIQNGKNIHRCPPQLILCIESHPRAPTPSSGVPLAPRGCQTPLLVAN